MIKVVSWMNQSLFVAWFYFLIGCLASFYAYTSTLQTQSFLKTGIETSGTVIEMKFRDQSYYPVVSFIDHKGLGQQFTSNAGCNPACYSVSDNVEVLYQPNGNPRPKINSFLSIWVGNILLATIGVGFIIIGLWQIYKLQYKSQTRGT